MVLPTVSQFGQGVRRITACVARGKMNQRIVLMA
jgi:hypothetical protein